jgi:hypothetical protein
MLFCYAFTTPFLNKVRLAKRQKTLDIARLECPAGVLLHLTSQWSKVSSVNIAAAHGNHAIDLAIVAKSRAATTAVSNMVNGS